MAILDALAELFFGNFCHVRRKTGADQRRRSGNGAKRVFAGHDPLSVTGGVRLPHRFLRLGRADGHGDIHQVISVNGLAIGNTAPF
jgi:hypothetical protein